MKSIHLSQTARVVNVGDAGRTFIARAVRYFTVPASFGSIGSGRASRASSALVVGNRPGRTFLVSRRAR